MEDYLVNIYHLDDEKGEQRVCWFSCKAFAEMIKFLFYCKKYNIDFFIRVDDESIGEEFKKYWNLPRSLDSFNVNYGSDECVQSIDVYLK